MTEAPTERLNRELSELLQELRVVLPGVQVLFAFLLTVPFSQRFAQVTPLQRTVYFTSLLFAALATAFLIAQRAVRRHRLCLRVRSGGRHYGDGGPGLRGPVVCAALERQAATLSRWRLVGADWRGVGAAGLEPAAKGL